MTLRTDVAQTTPTPAAVADAIRQHYALGPVDACALLRRGFNHVYGLRLGDGRRVVARLCADRPRGAPNVEYEAALLAHLKAAGAHVAASLPTMQGAAATTMDLPEGPRVLMLFEHLDGDPPDDALPDIAATGSGLARIHDAARHYAGPASRYALDLPQLLHASLDRLCGAPTVDDALRAEFVEIAQSLDTQLSAMQQLTRVHCHGDCHGSNNFMTNGPDGNRVASFFDFDDAGPGWLAYELAVYLWVMLPRTVDVELDARSREKWRHYLDGYRSVRDIADVDIAAIAPCLAVRHFWLLGEYAGRIDVWGTQTLPLPILRKSAQLMRQWASMDAGAIARG